MEEIELFQLSEKSFSFSVGAAEEFLEDQERSMSSVVLRQTFIARQRIHKSLLGFVKALLVPVLHNVTFIS